VDNVRNVVSELFALGKLPSEDCDDPEEIASYQKLIHQIQIPITDDEAKLLVTILGEDGCFGLAMTVVHIIETAPSWPLVDCLLNQNNEWVVELRDRANI
jgi:hypothetical protein